jgi:hypothetical protein
MRPLNKEQIKQKIADMLWVDSVDGLLWNYKPKKFKKGDIVVCIIGNPPVPNNGFSNEFIEGQLYKVFSYEYDESNLFVKAHVKIEGSSQYWEDDKFELASENKTEDVEYTDVTNQKLLSNKNERKISNQRR